MNCYICLKKISSNCKYEKDANGFKHPNCQQIFIKSKLKINSTNIVKFNKNKKIKAADHQKTIEDNTLGEIDEKW